MLPYRLKVNFIIRFLDSWSLNINDLNKIEMLKLTNEKLDDDKIEEFKQFALKKYGSSVCVPISLIILSKIKILEPKLIK